MFFIFTLSRRAVTYPSENNTDYLSLGLSAADSASLPDGWSTYVEFTLKVVNQIEDKYSVTKGTIFNLFLTVVTNELPCMYVEIQVVRCLFYLLYGLFSTPPPALFIRTLNKRDLVVILLLSSLISFPFWFLG